MRQLLGGVRGFDLNSCQEDDKFIFNRFPGGSAEGIVHYIDYALTKNTPDELSLSLGTNDVLNEVRKRSTPGNNEDTKEPLEIANLITLCARKGIDRGVKRVNIHGIPVIRGTRYQFFRNTINLHLKEACEREGFNFIDNGNICLNDLRDDGIHLNFSGTFKLKCHLLSTCPSFNPYLIR